MKTIHLIAQSLLLPLMLAGYLAGYVWAAIDLSFRKGYRDSSKPVFMVWSTAQEESQGQGRGG